MEATDPTGLGLGTFIAIVSALREKSIVEGAAIVGDMSVQGTYVTVSAINIGPRFTPSLVWIGFHMGMHYPAADV